MKRLLALVLVYGFWTIATAQTAYKPAVIEQQTSASQAESSYPIAGSPKLNADWERIRPILEGYTQSHPQQLRKTTAWNFTVGQNYTWWASDLSAANTYEYQVPSTCKAVGTNCYIFVEDALWNNGRVNQSAVDAMKTAFDSSTPADPTKGIYQLDTQYFGNPPNVDGDPRIIILILDIKDGYSGSGAYTAGYFYSLNEYSEASAQSSGSNRHSNYGEIYYIDGNPGDLRTLSGITTASSTTAHEFQHMIHWNYDRYEVTFVNEGISESASALCGYSLDSPSRYYANPNISFLSWRTTSDVLQDYSRAAIFTWYLVEQLGSGVAKQIVQSTATSIAGYNDAFSKMGSSLTFNDMLKSFAVANALNDKSVDSRYGFSLAMTSTISPTKTHLDPNVSMQSQSVEAQGTVYLLYKGGRNLSAMFASQYSTLSVRAIATGSGGKKVIDVPLSSQYSEPGFGTTYNQVIFAITNLSSSAVSFSYSSSGQSAAFLEFAFEDGVPEGYLYWSPGDTAAVWFDAIPGAVLDSIRVAFRRDGSIGFGVWKYSGAQRPSPLGKNYGFNNLSITGSPTFYFPYPVPYPNWRKIDVSSWNVDLNSGFAVGFVFGADATDPRLMISTEPLIQPHHSYTYSTGPSGKNWYTFVSNSSGDSAYRYVVRAYAHMRTGAVPSVPVLSAPADQSTGISTLPTLVWNTSPGTNSYHLQVSTSSSFAVMAVNDSTITDTMKVIGPLQNNSLYYWRVSAANAVGSSPYSNAASFTTILAAPDSPALTTPEDSAEVLSLNPLLAWASSGRATGYRIQLSTSPTFTTTVLDDPNSSPSFRYVGPLTTNITYYWRVNASGVGGTSAFSAVRRFKTIVKPFNGDQWASQVSGTNVTLYCVKAVSQSVAWSAGQGGQVLRTTNGGTTWIPVGGGLIGSSTIYAIEAIDANVALVTTSPTGSGTFIYRTTNAGANWIQVYSDPTPDAFIDAIKMYDANNGIALGDPVGGKWVVLKTVNGGITWNRISTEPSEIGTENAYNNVFCVVGPTNIWFGSNQGSRVYRSSDAGSTWGSSVLPAVVPGAVTTIWFTDQKSGVVATAAGSTLRSTDAGVTWMPISHGSTEGDIAVGGAGASDIWMQQGASIVRTTDSGASWSLSLNDPTYQASAIRDMDFVSNSISVSGWAAGANGVIFTFVGSLTNTIVAPQAPALYQPADNAINIPVAPALSWSRSTGATTYHLQLSLSSTFSTTIVNDSTVTDTIKVIGPLLNNSTYYWRVNAKNNVGMSDWSQARSFTTIMSAPQAPILATPTDSAINLQLNTSLSWNPVQGATVYHVQVSTAPFIPFTLDDSTISTTSKAIGPLALATTYFWHVRAKNDGGWSPFSFTRLFGTIRTTSVNQMGSAIPTEYALSQNYPNPFNPTTTIQFALPKSSRVSLKVVDALGKEIVSLVTQEFEPGYYTVRWQANVSSGIYFYRLQAGEFVETKKMILLK